MVSYSYIQNRIHELGSKGGIPLNYLKVFNASPQDGTPHVEITDQTYDYVIQERGFEFSRSQTYDLNELLFWIVDSASSRYAFDYEVDHRIINQDARRLAFSIKNDIMEKIDPTWAEMTRDYIEKTLANAPYVD
jgi:hypothetical protein